MRMRGWISDVCSSDLGVLRRDGGNPIEGLRVELVDAEGRVRAATLTELDGYFLFEGVAYGRYTVRLSKASAAALRLHGAFAMSAAPGQTAPRGRLGRRVLKPGRRHEFGRANRRERVGQCVWV